MFRTCNIVLLDMLYPQNNAFEMNTIVPVFQVKIWCLEVLSDLINAIKLEIMK